MWPLSQKVSQYPGSYHWSETLPFFSLLCAGQREGRNQGQNSGQVVLRFLRCKWPPATTPAAWRKEFERQNWGKMRSRIRSTSLVRGSRECESEPLPRCYNEERLVMRLGMKMWWRPSERKGLRWEEADYDWMEGDWLIAKLKPGLGQVRKRLG